MRQSIQSSARLLIASFASLGVGMGILVFLAGAGRLVENRTGGNFNIVLLILGPAAAGVWVSLILSKRYKWAFGMYLVMLPGLFRVQSLVAIVAYVDPSGWAQRISATTFALLALTVIVLASKVRVNQVNLTFRLVEILLWGYAIFGTVSQLLNHNITSAVLLSIGALWQFVGLFYIIDRIVTDERDARFILKCLLFSIIVNIFVRMAYEGWGFFLTGTNIAGADTDALLGTASHYYRVGSSTNAFGFAVSYGGYLAFSVPIAIYIFRLMSRKSARYIAIWAVVIGLILLELLSTFTRGAILSILLIPPLLLLWKSERSTAISLLMGLLATILIGIFVPMVSRALIGRGLFLDARFFQIQAVNIRPALWLQSLPHVFDNWGFGFGIGKSLYFYVPGIRTALPSHNLILELTQNVGAISTIFFISFFSIVMYTLFLASKKSNTKPNLSAYLFVALAVWFFFANTTSTSIVYYYPYEGTLLFYIVLFLATALCRNAYSKTLETRNASEICTQ